MKPSPQTATPGEWPSTRAFKALKKAAAWSRSDLAACRVLVARKLRLSDRVDLYGFFELFKLDH